MPLLLQLPLLSPSSRGQAPGSSNLQQTGTQQELQQPQPVLRIFSICPDCFYIPVCWSKCIELSCIWPPAWMHCFRLVVINISWPHIPCKETCREMVSRSESVKTEEWTFINKQAHSRLYLMFEQEKDKEKHGRDWQNSTELQRRADRKRQSEGGRINFSSSLCCYIDCK